MSGANYECSFQPQINTHSRRLARHAPTLRERQQQEERHCSTGVGRYGKQGSTQLLLSPCSAIPPRCNEVNWSGSKRQQAPVINQAVTRAHDHADEIASEAVWTLWRTVVNEEERAAQEDLQKLSPAVDQDGKPRAVPVSTVLRMLKSLGIQAPKHQSLIAKFLTAMEIDEVTEPEMGNCVVDADRFAEVFTAFWKAAVTTRGGGSPAAAQADTPRYNAGRDERNCVAAAESTAQHRPSSQAFTLTAAAAEVPQERVLRKPPPLPTMEPRTPASATQSPESASRSVSVASFSSPESQGSSGKADQAAQHFVLREWRSRSEEGDEDGSLPPTPISGASPATPSTKMPLSPVSSEGCSPVSKEVTGGLSLSPEPRNPLPPSMTPTGMRVNHRRPPSSMFSQSCCPSLFRGPRSTSLQVLPSDSHLLTTTTSIKLKKTEKRIPGGLMRECTFKPAINDTPVRTGRHSPPDAPRQCSSAIVRRNGSWPSAAAKLHPWGIDQAFPRRRDHDRWAHQHSTRSAPVGRDEEVSALRSEGRDSSINSCAEGRAPSAVASDTAVRRMIAARHQATAPRSPLLYVDVDLPHGAQDRIAVFSGDDLGDVARRFSALHGLDDTLRDRLAGILVEHLTKLTSVESF